MPFVGEDNHSGRKRRYNDDDERPLYSTYPSGDSMDIYYRKQRPELPLRKVLPTTKRPRMINDNILDTDDLSTSSRSRRLSQLKALQFQPANKNRVTNALAPCHICHRRPTKKTHLDSFADCQGCGERACFVCLRECHGWNTDGVSGVSEQEMLSRSFHMDDVDNEPQHSATSKDGQQQSNEGWKAVGHQAVVCSRCCIERGTEGDVTCLGCFSRMEGS
ncbi:hypothetical protein HYE67_008497 [Fusarium culmorum]|uniref:Uncharacterized protein n=1 Tax=Fusarium culmorum TaxID=5516 RepID=A0A2T4H684_FUSCU|nr:hypothetical protein FCULG_00003193 [Fusarium culmorum]QPC66266.1 hypothetical protein HYE67_008497 [Fusarium culmorum]